MAITLRQAATNANSRRDGRYCTVTFDQPTKPGSLILVAAAVRSERVGVFMDDSNFVEIRERIQGGVTLDLWYYEGAPSKNSVVVNIDRSKAFEVIALEYEDVRRTGALDRQVSYGRSDNSCDTGTSAATTQSDSLVFAVVANAHESCRQSGFTGGLTRLFDRVTPSVDNDDERIRMTAHQYIAAATAQFRLRGSLSSRRDWAAILATFKGASTGPARFTARSTDLDNAGCRIGGTAGLTAFGPLTTSINKPSVATITGSGDMWPFDYQYSLNNRQLLIGFGTDYRVLAAEGLEGWQMRSSDTDQPLGDGAIRGVDLQAPREVVFNLGMIPSGGTTTDVQAALQTLQQALVPRRNDDWELLWRHPGSGVWMLRCRPIDLIRGLDAKRVLFQDQRFALRAVDPRHYSPTVTTVAVPVTSGVIPTTVTVTNEGNAPAYPIIRVTPHATISRLELFNDTTGVVFDVTTTVGSGSKLVADMDARVRSLGTSPVTLDAVSKYGAWQFPRETWRLDADPVAEGGANQVWLRTTPDGANVSCTIEYRHTRYG